MAQEQTHFQDTLNALSLSLPGKVSHSTDWASTCHVAEDDLEPRIILHLSVSLPSARLQMCTTTADSRYYEVLGTKLRLPDC